MKKTLIISLLICLGHCAYSQVNPSALGLRLGGDGNINGAEISYQKGIGESNRFELDLGIGGNRRSSRISLSGIYHWNWNIKGGLNWYAGPGAILGIYSNDNADDYVNVGLGGQIGIEYDFKTLNTPLLLSIDTRPMWDFIGDNAGIGWGSALGIRYLW